MTALVIRFAVFAQAALCTSILANLALQKSHVTLPNFVSMALLQYQNNGPHQLVVDFFDSCKRGKAVIVGLLAVFLLLTISVMQFTTILLSDLQISPRAGLVRNTSIPSTLDWDAGISSQATWFGEGYMLLPPARYPAFAEYSEVGEVRKAIEVVCDTEVVMRAFIAILQKSSQEMLQSDEGKATVLDSRVVCGHPVVK
ncbi:uncharacterized protein Z519_06571 [Cladophialophora bantiana CBS 173.52]|uniref:Uncharacterized protein n=1 Tax=Cladophialophora bantiana (strain ATCC 10958 / CBS 173.52 / CDC B-1940 / NIH 8579) TaxID=1442370 RepID=A0A0D2HHH9_CLAB1|nr:uncharacterized protein Z519_06571 [Cladophialophora bantiana CBS 173.52]KIW92723.1 hypothetical protein Z519_06571 [Cladophialophora bantiana CBS 173.52]